MFYTQHHPQCNLLSASKNTVQKVLIVLVICFTMLRQSFAQNFVQTPFQTSAVTKGFIENKGQIIDQNQQPNTLVKYIYTNGLFNLQLKNDGFSYEIFELKEKSNEQALKNSFEDNPRKKNEEEIPDYEFHASRIDVKFVGATAYHLVAAEPSESLFNYYTVNCGTNGITGVRSFSRITYKNVYDGIDLCFYTPDQENPSLKYEWVIHPEADASQIKMQYAGALALNQLEDGSIDVLTAKGKINEGKIVAYGAEDNHPALVNYLLNGQVLSYHLVEKNHKTLIIDPNITWFSYYGGVSTEDLFEGEMAIDGKASPLLAGNTSSPAYIASTGAYQVTYGDGGVDGFVAKFKPSGQLAWATYYGSYDRDGCHAITADAAYNVFVGGNTYSASGISTAGSHQEIFGGSMDAFLAKFNSKGIRLWATYYGGTGYGDQINGVECDASGNIFFTGYTCSPNNISTPGAYQEVYNGVDNITGDVMVGEFTNDGVRLWASYLSGPGQDRAHDIVLLNNGDFYIEGTCESTTGFATPGIHQSNYGGGEQDAFVAKWHANGQLVWCSYYGGEKEEHGRGLAIDSSNNAYVGGWTISTTGISTAGSAQAYWFAGYNNQGDPSPDAYLGKFSPEGQLLYGTYYGGKDLERLRGITIDKKNDFVYVVGQAGSKTNVASSNIFKPDTGLVDQEGFVSKYSGSGNLIYSYLVGGEGKQNVFDVDLDKFNSLYLFMTTDETIYTTSGVYQGAPYGSEDVVLIKLNPGDSCFDKYEPNNSNLTASGITTSTDTSFFGYTGVITKANDADWFVVKTGITNLKVELLDLLADYDIYLYKSNSQLIASSINSGSSDESIIFNNIPKGKYYIRIIAANTDFEPNACYRLRALTSPGPWLTKKADPALLSDQLGMQVSVFPNPTAEIVNVKIISQKSSVIQATVFDLSNRVVADVDVTLDEGTQQFSIQVAQLPPGIYLLKLETDGKQLLTRLVVQR